MSTFNVHSPITSTEREVLINFLLAMLESEAEMARCLPVKSSFCQRIRPSVISTSGVESDKEDSQRMLLLVLKRRNVVVSIPGG